MLSKFEKKFINPPEENSLAPFWFLNDDMKSDDLIWQINEMYSKHIYECILHARKGLTVPYLSEEWFEKIGIILDEACKLGMRIYIYDEDNWPSGYAGGKVIEENPNFSAKCLAVEKIVPIIGQKLEIEKNPKKPIVRIIAVHKNEEFFDITNKDWVSTELQYEVFVFRMEECSHHPAYSDKPYVNLLNKNATEQFIKVTHSEYKKRFPKHWGTTIKGFFTDEPGFYQNYIYQTANLNTIPWTEDFPEYFNKKNGYDIMLYLGSIWDDMGELSKKTRRDFFETLTELYNENYFKVIHDYLNRDGLISIGHLHMEEHLENIVPMEGNFFSDMKYLDYAGIDRIERDRNRVTEKLGSSAIHLQGKKYCCSETFGCFGWGLTLEEMKSEADWQYVQGVNKLIPHAFYFSIEKFRKNECPPSEFYQNTFWNQFTVFSDYISRLSFALSEGDFCANILVYYPIKSCYEQFQPLNTYNIKRIDEQFINLSMYLLNNQIDFDYLYDEALENATIQNDGLKINNTIYKAIIIPPITTIPCKTISFIKEMANKNIKIIDLSKTEILKDIIQLNSVKTCEIKLLLNNENLLDFKLYEEDEKIKYQHRKIENGDLYFIINEDKFKKTFVVNLKAEGHCTKMDILTGKSINLSFVSRNGRAILPLELDGYGSTILYFKKKESNIIPIENFDITLPNEKIEHHLLPWDDYKIPNYSGKISYKASFEINDVQKFKNIILDIGDVYETAEIILNEIKASDIVWQPHTVNIKNYLKNGENKLEIVVSNTPLNSFTTEKKLSGLLGPVKIEIDY